MANAACTATRLSTALVLLFAFLWLSPAQAQSDADASDAPAPQVADREKSLDDELLEGLGGEPVEGLEDKKDKSPPKPKPSGDSLDDELLKGLGDGEDVKLGGEQDPLSNISERMREVERLIAEADAGEGTQGKQREIAAEMDKLIRELQKQCQACKQGSGKRQKSSGRGKVGQPDQANQPSDQAARDSSDRLKDKKTEKPDTEAMKEMVKAAWGHLPEHLRNEMVQLPRIEFLPQYLPLIEDYFKALAKPARRKE